MLMKPDVSVIVAAYNEEETIGRCIKSLLSQAYTKKEIIVVNDGSTDRTGNIAKKYPVRLLDNKRNMGFGFSVNRAIKTAKGSIVIIFHADHVLKDRKWIDKMIDPFSDERIAAVVSQRINAKEIGTAEKLLDSLSPHELINNTSKPKEIMFFRIKADAYRKSVIEKLGYFDNKYFPDGGEDNDLSIKMRKAGYRIVLSDKAVAENMFSSRQRSVKDIMKKALVWGDIASRLHRRHGFDGLRTRLFLLCLFSFIATPTLLIPEMAFGIYLAIAALSFFHSITIPRIKLKIPVGIVTAIIFAILIYLQKTFITAVPVTVILTSAFICLYFSACSAVSSAKHDIKIFPIAFLFAFAWRMLSGIGYAKGWVKLMRL